MKVQLHSLLNIISQFPQLKIKETDGSSKHSSGCWYMGISQKGIIKYKGLPGDSAGKESACNVGDLGSIPELGRSLGEGNGCPLQYFGPENSIDCIVHGVTKSQTQLSDFNFTIKCKVTGIDYFWKHSLLGPEFHGASNFFFFLLLISSPTRDQTCIPCIRSTES